MSFIWVRGTAKWERAKHYRWSTAPKDTAFVATNRTYALRRWVRARAVVIGYGVLIAAGLTIGVMLP